MTDRPSDPFPIRARLIPAATLRAVPWKNGGGVTREIACEPPAAGYDTFLWRISVADVERPGPFSRFPGIDRSIVLMRGGSMLLAAGQGGRHALRSWEPWHFAGEDAMDAELPSGPTQDFNVMQRRAAVVSQTTVRRASQTLVLGPGTALLYCAAGACTVTPMDADWPAAAGMPAARARLALGEGDTLRLDLASGAALTLAVDMPEPAARLIDVRLEAAGPRTDTAPGAPADTNLSVSTGGAAGAGNGIHNEISTDIEAAT